MLSSVPPPPPRTAPAPAPEHVPEPEPPAEPAQKAEPVPEPTKQATKPAPSAKPAEPRAVKPATPPAPVPLRDQPITQTRIPAALFERVRAAKNETGDTHETWFLDAFDAVYDQLAEHYGPGPARRSRVPVRKRRTRRPTGDPLVSYPLRLMPDEIVVLQERYEELGPPSMADFVTTIVRLRLEQLEK